MNFNCSNCNNAFSISGDRGYVNSKDSVIIICCTKDSLECQVSPRKES